MVIAITIMAVLVTFSNRAVQSGLKSKVKIQDQVDEYSTVRDALRVMSEDIGQAYHYRDIEMEFKNAVQSAAKSAAPPPTPQPNPQSRSGAPANPGTNPEATQAAQATAQTLQRWMMKDPYRVDPSTQFWGNDTEVYFITMHAGRLREDVVQADFVKVSYKQAPCHRPGDPGNSGLCLLRSETPFVEGDFKKTGPSTIMVQNVNEFKLRYIGHGSTDWVSQWDSVGGDGAAKGNFPEAVEISLTTLKGDGTAKKKIAMHIVAPVHFPNNGKVNSNGPQPGQPLPPGQAPTPTSEPAIP